MNIKEFWGKHKYIIIISLVGLFAFSKCTTSCSRQQVIKRQNQEIATMDSIINAQKHDLEIMDIECDNLSEQLNSEISHTYNVTAVGTNTNKQLIQKMDSITAENRRLKTENKKLKQQISELQNPQN